MAGRFILISLCFPPLLSSFSSFPSLLSLYLCLSCFLFSSCSSLPPLPPPLSLPLTVGRGLRGVAAPRTDADRRRAHFSVLRRAIASSLRQDCISLSQTRGGLGTARAAGRSSGLGRNRFVGISVLSFLSFTSSLSDRTTVLTV